MDTSFFSPEAKAYIDQEVYRARAPGANAQNAQRNRAYGHALVPTGVTNATPLIILAAILSVRQSGVFQASVDLSLTGITATDTTSIAIGTQTAALGVMALATATQSGPGASSTNGSPAPPLPLNGVYVSNLAAGIVVTGGTNALIQYATGNLVAPTTGSTDSLAFAWSGIIDNSTAGNAEVPFTRGNQVILTVTITATHSASITYAGAGVSLLELA
jgi:hypothetical protein